MKSIIVLTLMTVTFAIFAATSMTLPQQDDATVLGDLEQPALTGEMIDQFRDSVETVLGVTLSEEQGDELHGLIMRTWRLRDRHGIDMVMESVDCWRSLRELPPGERARLAGRLRPQAVAHLRQGGGGEIEMWMLSVHERAAANTTTARAAAE